jgi:hypothetical protein
MRVYVTIEGSHRDTTGTTGQKGEAQMILEQNYIECLSQPSSRIGDESTEHPIVLDPPRDIIDYLADAHAIA